MSKYFYSYADVAHAWIHEQYPSAHSAGERTSFSGKEIFSYSTSMGKIYEVKGKGKVVLLNDNHYSMTTIKHQSAIRQAIPGYIDIVNVGSNCGYLNHAGSIKHILAKIEHFCKLQEKARKLDYTSEIKSWANQLETYLHYFPVKTKMMKHVENKKLFKAVLDNGDEWLESVMGEAKNAEKARISFRKQQQKQREKAAAKLVAEWLNGMHYKDALIRSNLGKVYLRLVPGEYNTDGPRLGVLKSSMVQTSLGVEVPANEAMNLYKAVTKIHTDITSASAAEEFMEKLGITEIGGWKINRVTKDGDIIAGCHSIPYSEIDRFAVKYGWKSN